MAGAEDHSLSAQLSSMSLKQAVDECVEDAQAFMIPPTSPTKKPTESGMGANRLVWGELFFSFSFCAAAEPN